VDIDAASDAGYQRMAQGTVAVVSVATGAVRDGGGAAPGRAGVAEIRRDAAGALERQDVARTLGEIRQARTNADVVIAYQHNHYWEPAPEDTPGWQREFARECIDAGAGVFVSHGPPLLQGVEMYRGSPLLYGLGSFIFQTKKPEASYSTSNWQSLVVECRFVGGKFIEARLTPIQLASIGVGGADDLETRGRPSLAEGRDARRILDDVQRLSGRLGHRLSHDGRTAVLRGTAT
jgi:poly-gamma-glutamate synthesis protein (capsule biosynthesis protein)